VTPSYRRQAPIETITELEATLRLVVAAVLGGIIGFDRERRNKAAGIRTHMLVSLGASSFIVVAYFLIADLGGEEASGSGVRLDPIAVVQGIVTGVGFIGAGQIFQQRGAVRGLTGAAGIWVTAAIGTLVGTGHYVAPVAATLLAFVIIAVLGKLEELVAGDSRAE
jgi:putative Mg2+ transporter-C (MgtC) family protein